MTNTNGSPNVLFFVRETPYEDSASDSFFSTYNAARIFCFKAYGDASGRIYVKAQCSECRAYRCHPADASPKCSSCQTDRDGRYDYHAKELYKGVSLLAPLCDNIATDRNCARRDITVIALKMFIRESGNVRTPTHIGQIEVEYDPIREYRAIYGFDADGNVQCYMD